MAQKFLVNLDLNKNELQNAKVQNLGTAPGSPTAGQIYYDTGANELYVYNGSGWVSLQAVGDITGVTAGTGLSGGGTSGTVTVNFAPTGLASATVASNDKVIIADADDSDTPKTVTAASIAALAPQGDVTSVTAGTNLNGGGTTGDVTINLDDDVSISTLTASGLITANGGITIQATDTLTFDSVALTTVQTSGESFADNDTSLMTSAAIDDRILARTVNSLTGTANEVEVSASTGAVTVGLPNNVTISGNLTVNGDTTTVNTATLSVEDPLIILANGNNGADSVDIGFYGLYDTSGSQDLYAGLFRDANDSGKFKLFKDLQVEPTTTVNTGGTGYAAATLVVGTLEGAVTGDLTGTVLTASQTNITAIGTISTGTWQATDIAVAHGGTGASTAANARTNLASTSSGNTSTPTLARVAAIDCAADSSGTSATTVTHNFGTRDVHVQIYDASSYDEVQGDIVRTDTNTVTVTLLGTISAGDYRIVVTG